MGGVSCEGVQVVLFNGKVDAVFVAVVEVQGAEVELIEREVAVF